MNPKDLTMKDMEGVEIEGKCPFHILVATAVRAMEILDQQEKGHEEGRAEAAINHEHEEQGEGLEHEPEEAINHEEEAEQEQLEAINHEEEQGEAEEAAPPGLPQNVKDVIQFIMANGGDVSEEILVIQKRLFHSDISKQHGRLSMPIMQLANDEFLTGDEKVYLRGKNAAGNNNYIGVRIVEPSLEQCAAKFCRWDMAKKKGKTSSFYLINGMWRHIVERNNLTVGMVLQVWSFRIDNALCFALVRVE